jgi:N-acyl-D-aspartate/D-glutamate deacylase
MNELVIRGGTVVDGTGAPSIRADVGITGGRITEVGDDVQGTRVLEADGHIVAPGFIDIHTHYDAQVFWDPALTPSCFHGVTTVVAGNCGFSIAPTRPDHRDLIARTLENVEDMDVAALAAGVPWDEFSTFPEYLAAVERSGLGLNYTAYIGHTALRLFAMGDDAYERAATAEEIASMRTIVGEALDAGAAGFATSFAITHRGADGKPVPSRFAERAELDGILATVAEKRRGVVAFTPGDLVGVDDLYDIQPGVGVPFTFTALLTMPSGNHRRIIDVNRAGWAKGAEVWPQVSPRPLKFTMSMAEPFTLNINPEFAALMSASPEARRAAYADPAWREVAVKGWEGAALAPRWNTYEIAESKLHPELEGRRLTAIAADRGHEPFDTLLDLAIDEPTIRVACMLANDDADEVAIVLAEQHVALGLSDAGAHVGQLCDAPQATDYLANFVRDRQVLTIESAIHRLSGAQADMFGMADRGQIAPGAWADVAVFDLDTVAPGPIRRVADFPAGSERLTADAPGGMRHVLVNGTPIRVDGENDLSARAGQLVKPTPRA